MWQPEEISKVFLNVVQNSSEGCIREVFYHCHSGKEQSSGINANICRYTVKHFYIVKNKIHVKEGDIYGNVAANPALRTLRSNSGFFLSSSTIHFLW